MNAFTKEFWEDRAKRFGHTGHSEPFLYCFDQEARKYAIDTVMTKNNLHNKKNALDFGCGSGDFLPVINKYAEKVLGYDIAEKVVEVAKQKHRNNTSVILTADTSDITTNAPYDLIATIGVQQTLSEEQLDRTISFLLGCMQTGAHMVSMEFFSTVAKSSEQNENKATKTEWLNIISRYNLKIITEYSFYNPIIHPSASWHRYNRGLYMNLLKPFKHTASVQGILSKTAREIIYREKDVLAPPNDIFKIYLLQKR